MNTGIKKPLHRSGTGQLGVSAAEPDQEVLQLTDHGAEILAVTGKANGFQVTGMADEIVHGQVDGFKGFL